MATAAPPAVPPDAAPPAVPNQAPQSMSSATGGTTAADYAKGNLAPFDPTGWTQTGGNADSTVWRNDKTGEIAFVSRKDGRVEDVLPPGSSNDFKASDFTSAIRKQTDNLGITTPDPHGSPEFNNILNASNAFGDFYSQDRANVTDSRNMDLDTIARLRAAEEGKTPSAAEMLMRKAIDQNASQGLGLAATVGGSNPGMALRAGLESQAQAGARSAADIGALRAKEMDASRALLAQQTDRRSAIDASGASSTGNTFANIVGAPFAAKERADASNQALWGTALAAYAASDIREKKDVQPAPGMADDFLSSLSPEEQTRLQVAGAAKEQGSPYVKMQAADDFLSTLKPQSFEYKAPDGKNLKPGKRMGVMAQDLPAHDVVTAPDGKKWISADVMSDVLAGMGRLHDRVGAMEAGKGAKPAAPQSDAMSQPMIPRDAVHDYLASMGITPP